MGLDVTDDTQERRMTLLLFHCIFNEGGSITNFMHEIDLKLYRSLPNLYAVCIADTSKQLKKVTGGFFIMTDYSHNDEDFIETLYDAVEAVPRLAQLITEHSSFLPGRMATPEGPPPSENEMLQVMVSQALKHSSVGVA